MAAYGWDSQQIAEELETYRAQQQEQLAAYEAEMEKHRFVVWPENRDAVRVFLAIDCDWQKPGPMGGDFRLPTSEIESAIRLAGIEKPGDCWSRIQLMKRVAIPILREKARAK